MFPFIIMILIYTFMAVPYSIFVDRVTYHYIRPKWIKFMASSFLYIIGGIIGLRQSIAETVRCSRICGLNKFIQEKEQLNNLSKEILP